MNKTFIKQPK